MGVFRLDEGDLRYGLLDTELTLILGSFTFFLLLQSLEVHYVSLGHLCDNLRLDDVGIRVTDPLAFIHGNRLKSGNGHGRWNDSEVDNFHLVSIDGDSLYRCGSPHANRALALVLRIRIVVEEEVFEVLIVFIAEYLRSFPLKRKIKSSYNAHVNLEHMRECSEPLARLDSLHLSALEVSIFEDFRAVTMEEAEFVGSHDAEAGL